MTLLFDEYSTLLEQQEEETSQNETSSGDFEQEFLPLKKYYLIQRLYTLQAKLDEYNLQNKDLNTVLQFNKELGYDSIVHLTKGIMPFLQQQIKGATVDEK